MGSQKMTFDRVGSILGLIVLTAPSVWWCSALPLPPPQVGLHSGPAPVYSREGLPIPRVSSARKGEAGTGTNTANQGSRSDNSNNNRYNVNTISSSNIISSFNTNKANVV